MTPQYQRELEPLVLLTELSPTQLADAHCPKSLQKRQQSSSFATSGYAYLAGAAQLQAVDLVAPV